MNQTLFDVLSAGGAVLAAVVAGWFSQHIARKAADRDADTKNKQIEAGAFQRARSIEAEAVKFLRDEYSRVIDELAEMRAQLAEARAELTAQRERGDQLERNLYMANRKVQDLTARLAAAGIALTPTQES